MTQKPISDEAEFYALFGNDAAAPTADATSLFEQLTADFPDLQTNSQVRADFFALKPATQRILAAIAAVPYGTVSSYRDIGLEAGLINGARQVARALYGLSDKYQLPWWRIIRADNRIGLTGSARQEQIAHLCAEGLEVTDSGKVLS